jgi:hypothetical protein
VHANPEASKAEFVGWVVPHGFDPSQTPVLYRSELSYVDDAGGVHGYEAVGA